MVKNFSVDWLAQSYHDAMPKHDPMGNMSSHCRPHVPCLVQPRPPTSYDKGYLQPKPKAATTELSEATEKPKYQVASLSSPLHPASCSSPISENGGYSSGYESEAASSECPSFEEGSEGERDGIQRRVRTKFTPEQIHKLEKIFSKHKYLDAGERVKTAMKLSLSETQVRTWFQNRRMKLKREVQDLRAEYLAPGLSPLLFPPVPAPQYHGYSGQRLYVPPARHMLYPPVMQQVPMQQMISHHPGYPMMPTTRYY